MKNIKLFIFGLIILFFSLVYTNEVSLYRITPSFLLPWVIYISMRLNYKVCMSYSFFFSLANELLNPQLLGFTSMLYVILSHFTNKYHESFNKDKFTTILFSLFLINFIFYSIHWIYFSFTSSDTLYLLQKTGINIVYSTLVSCMIIGLIYLADKVRINFS